MPFTNQHPHIQGTPAPSNQYSQIYHQAQPSHPLLHHVTRWDGTSVSPGLWLEEIDGHLEGEAER